MTFHGYRDKALQDRHAIEKLAEGKDRRTVAAELGVSYSTMRRRLSRHVRAIGCETVEQAVALQTAAKIKLALPIALQSAVDLVMKLRST
ncbi:MAG TPA: hypothetical protein VGJ78_12650 [Vicinamibacterales bacterium]